VRTTLLCEKHFCEKNTFVRTIFCANKTLLCRSHCGCKHLFGAENIVRIHFCANDIFCAKNFLCENIFVRKTASFVRMMLVRIVNESSASKTSTN
jgi:hypothetical protein